MQVFWRGDESLSRRGHFSFGMGLSFGGESAYKPGENGGLVKVVVTGAGGMLGRDFCSILADAGHEVVALDRAALDVTSEEAVSAAVPESDWIVNLAAYTRVDDAESDRESATAVNVDGPRNLAGRAAVTGARLLHISTDYVFDGAGDRALVEDDVTRPLSVYGETKLEGEKAVLAVCPDALIVRTQSLFGQHGSNFVATMLRLMGDATEPLRVVDDQFSAPTWTRHLASALLALMDARASGVVHVAASGSCSWCDFARAIAAEIGSEVEITAVPTSSFPRPARRPAFGVLDSSRYTALVGAAMPSWQEGLRGYLAESGGIS